MMLPNHSWESPWQGVCVQVSLKSNAGIPIVVHQKRIWLGTIELEVWSLASFSGLGIQCCCGLWCGSQARLGSGVAVVLAWAIGNSSNWTPGLGTSVCHGYGPKKAKKTPTKNKNQKQCKWPSLNWVVPNNSSHCLLDPGSILWDF